MGGRHLNPIAFSDRLDHSLRSIWPLLNRGREHRTATHLTTTTTSSHSRLHARDDAQCAAPHETTIDPVRNKCRAHGRIAPINVPLMSPSKALHRRRLCD